MTRNQPFRRGATLRTVLETADQRRDGRLPTDVPGVAECFRDDLDLAAALSLRWHARLASEIAAEQEATPGADRQAAVVRAWTRAATRAAGLRLVLDECLLHPTSHEMAVALATAERREWERVANAAGLDGADDGLRLTRYARRAAFGPDAEAPIPIVVPAPRRPLDSGRPADLGSLASTAGDERLPQPEPEGEPVPRASSTSIAGNGDQTATQTGTQTATRTVPRTPSLVARIRSALAA